jgi:hypothetical protein
MSEELIEDILPEIKKWVRFNEVGEQIETSTSVVKPEGDLWIEIDEFVYGRHMILDNGVPRVMTDVEHADWEANMLITGAKSAVRHLRNVKLAESDWTETAPMSDELKQAWREYRQALRDLPEDVVDYNVEWPLPPA